MSKTLIVYAHPNPGSFNHAIAETAEAALKAAGHEVRVRDLYSIGFNPVLAESDLANVKSKSPAADVKAEQDHLMWADHLVFTYPIWWYGRPAILQGYIDRVFTYGFAYAGGGKGLLPHKSAVVFQTTGHPEATYEAHGFDAAVHVPMIEGTLQYCGIKDARIKTFYAVAKEDDAARIQMLNEVKELVGEIA
jgi:NAD(P)H dehydrogenase (quinone)